MLSNIVYLVIQQTVSDRKQLPYYTGRPYVKPVRSQHVKAHKYTDEIPKITHLFRVQLTQLFNEGLVKLSNKKD